jgi:hypothetical protein
MNYLSLFSNYLKSLSSSVDPTIYKTRMNTYLAPSSSFIEKGLARLELSFKDFYLNIFLFCLFLYNKNNFFPMPPHVPYGLRSLPSRLI